MIDLHEVNDAINKLPVGSKTKDLDALIKEFYKRKEPVSYDSKLLKENVWLAKAFFFINAKYIRDPNEVLKFIDKFKGVFYYWYSTDSIIRLVNKADPCLMMKFANKYVCSKKTYDRRWGYVMFMFHPIKKDINFVKNYLPLFKDDNENTVQMAEAWLLCEFAIFHPEIIYDFLRAKSLSYDITTKAIGKINDSFRISNEMKKKFKQIRSLYR